MNGASSRLTVVERLVERLVRRGLVLVALGLPEAAPVAADVPVRELLDDEALDCHAPRDLARRRRARSRTVSIELVQPRNDPAVEQRPLVERNRLPSSIGSKPSSRA